MPVVVASLAVGGESRGAEAHSEGGVDAALRRLLVEKVATESPAVQKVDETTPRHTVVARTAGMAVERATVE